MGSDPERVAETLRAAWARHNKAAARATMSDDVTCGLYIPQEVLPFGGGPSVGKRTLSDRMQSIHDVFEPLKYRGEIVAAAGRTMSISTG